MSYKRKIIPIVLSFRNLFGFFLINLSIFSQADTVYFSSDKVGLILFTNNIDSIKYYLEVPPLNPFSPSMESYSLRINSYDSTKLIIKVKNVNEEILLVYIWNKIPPGAYRFDWWQYIDFRNFSSGKFSVEKIFNNKTTVNTLLIIK